MPRPPDPEVERYERELTAALRARQSAEKVVDKRRDELAAKIVEAYRSGKFKAARIAKVVDYTPEHVRRILRAHDIQGDPNRIPPHVHAARRDEAAAG